MQQEIELSSLINEIEQLPQKHCQRVGQTNYNKTLYKMLRRYLQHRLTQTRLSAGVNPIQ